MLPYYQTLEDIPPAFRQYAANNAGRPGEGEPHTTAQRNSRYSRSAEMQDILFLMLVLLCFSAE